MQQGRTLVDLARVIGGNKGSLSAVETGAIRPPRLKKLLHWAQELGLRGEELAIQAWAQRSPREIRSLVMERLYGQSAPERSARAQIQARARLRQSFRGALARAMQDLHKALDDLTG